MDGDIGGGEDEDDMDVFLAWRGAGRTRVRVRVRVRGRWGSMGYAPGIAKGGDIDLDRTLDVSD